MLKTSAWPRTLITGLVLSSVGGTELGRLKPPRSDGRIHLVFAGIGAKIKAERLQTRVRMFKMLGDQLGAAYDIVLYCNELSSKARSVMSTDAAVNFAYEPTIHALGRTNRLAKARNKLIVLLQTSGVLTANSYVILHDLDANCQFNAEVFSEALARDDEWDAVSFRDFMYWDRWAFRHPTLAPGNMFGQTGRKNKLVSTRSFELWMNKTEFGTLIPVDSAFMIVAIYKASAFASGAKYSGFFDGERDCEHVAFHASLRSRGYRIRILNRYFLN